jgi:hypothetical protein
LRESIFGLDRSEERSLAIYPDFDGISQCHFHCGCDRRRHYRDGGGGRRNGSNRRRHAGRVHSSNLRRYVGHFTRAAKIGTITDNHATDNDVLDLSALLDANFGASSNVADFVRVTQTGSNVTVQVDPDGAAGGANFSGVAILSGHGTANPDPVLVYFAGANHTLTA